MPKALVLPGDPSSGSLIVAPLAVDKSRPGAPDEVAQDFHPELLQSPRSSPYRHRLPLDWRARAPTQVSSSCASTRDEYFAVFDRAAKLAAIPAGASGGLCRQSQLCDYKRTSVDRSFNPMQYLQIGATLFDRLMAYFLGLAGLCGGRVAPTAKVWGCSKLWSDFFSDRWSCFI
jgi:hypothetical protein